MRKVVVNAKYGGFSLSDAAIELYATLSDIRLAKSARAYYVDVDKYFDTRAIARDDVNLVKVVEQLGVAANGEHASLRVIEIPADVEYSIEEYDGNEHVAEVHRTWYP